LAANIVETMTSDLNATPAEPSFTWPSAVAHRLLDSDREVRLACRDWFICMFA